MLEKYPSTEAEWNDVLQNYPDLSWGWAHRGEFYLQKGDYPAALADFNQALKLKQDDCWALVHRGEVLRLMGAYDQAITDFDRGLWEKPDYPWALAHRGAVFFHLKKYQSAVCDLNQALSLDPTYSWALIFRSNAHVAMNAHEKALEDIDQIMALPVVVPPDQWLGEKAMVLNFLGRFEESIQWCQQALHKQPDDHVAHYSLAVAQNCWSSGANAGEFLNKAQVALEALLPHPSPWGILYRLGGIACLQKKETRALDYLRQACELNWEPGLWAVHDPAWNTLQKTISFQEIITNC